MTRKIRKAAVIGSGVMGGGIAALLAGAGVKPCGLGARDTRELERASLDLSASLCLVREPSQGAEAPPPKVSCQS